MGAVGEEGVGDFNLGHGGFDAFRELHAEVVAAAFLLFSQAEEARHGTDGGALGEEGDEGDEEYDVEDDVGAFYFSDEGVGGEDDGHCAAEPDPGDVEFGAAGHAAEGCKAEEYAKGACEEHHEEADEEPEPCDGEQLVGVDEEPEGEEHDNLEEPREPVEEGGDALFVLHLVVADDEPGDVDGEVAVAFDEFRAGEDEEYAGEEEDGVEGLVGDVEAVYHPYDEFAEEEAGERADGELYEEHEEGVPEADFACGRLHDFDEEEGEHVCHGVVAAAFELEHGSELFFEPLAFAAEDGEYGGGVGGGHDGCHEEGGGDGEGGVGGDEAAEPVDEEPGEGGGEDDAEGGEGDALPEDGADFGVFGVHAAGEEDDAEGYHADELGAGGVVELDAEAVAAEEHADAEEEDEDGDAEAGAGFAYEYAEEE